MERGVVRKVLVCFFQEAEHVDQAPVEKVAFDIRVDDGGSVDPICLQVESDLDTLRFAVFFGVLKTMKCKAVVYCFCGSAR